MTNELKATLFDLDRKQMGYLFKQCDELFNSLYGKHICVVKFLTAFMSSKCRNVMECGKTELLSMAVEDLMETYIKVDLKGDFSQFISEVDESANYDENQLLWVGWFYVYMHWYLKVSSKDLLKVQSIEEALEQYWCGHQMGFESLIIRLLWMFKEKGIKVDLTALKPWLDDEKSNANDEYAWDELPS